MPRVIEEFEEFKSRMNCPYVTVGRDGFAAREGTSFGGERYLAIFANGARSDMERGHTDPPADPKRRAELIRQFLVTRVKYRERDFNALDKGIRQQVEWNQSFPETCPPPREGDMKRLRLMSFLVKSARTELEIFDAANPGVDPKQQKVADAISAAEVKNEREAGLDRIVGEAASLRNELFPSVSGASFASADLKEPTYY